MGAEDFVGAADIWRMGIAFGFGQSDYKLATDPGNEARGNADHYALAAYVKRTIDDVKIKTGAIYGYHNVETDRTVSFTGYASRQKTDYDAHTILSFAEASVALAPTEDFAFEPFANVSYGFAHMSAFSETGGDARLTGLRDDADFGDATLGLRAEQILPFMESVSLNGQLGLRHRIGEITPKRTFAFENAATFETAGAKFARDSFLLRAGIGIELSSQAALTFGYAGSYAPATISQSLSGTLNWSF